MENTYKTHGVLSSQRRSVINPATDALNIIVGHYGYEQTKPKKEAVSSSDYHTFRLHYIVKGSVFYYLNGTEKKLSNNTCFLLSPQTKSFYKTNPKNPAVIFWVSFSGIDALNLTDIMGFSNSNSALELTSPYKKRLISLMQDNFKMPAEEIIPVVLLKNFLGIVELLAEFSDSQNYNNKIHYKNAYIELAVKFIEENYNKPSLSINDAALYVSVHKNYLSALFKNNLGVTFTQYLTQKRIEQATILLKTTNYSVSDIATMVGYLDQLYFSKIFKKLNNLSPLQYRKQETKLLLPHNN